MFQEILERCHHLYWQNHLGSFVTLLGNFISQDFRAVCQATKYEGEIKVIMATFTQGWVAQHRTFLYSTQHTLLYRGLQRRQPFPGHLLAKGRNPTSRCAGPCAVQYGWNVHVLLIWHCRLQLGILSRIQLKLRNNFICEWLTQGLTHLQIENVSNSITSSSSLAEVSWYTDSRDSY